MKDSDLRPVACADRALFQKALAERETCSCECAFANLILWQKPYDEVFFEHAGRLVVVERATRLMHFPIGRTLPPQELAALAGELQRNGLGNGTIYDVPEEYWTGQSVECAKWFDVEIDEDAFDYLYELEHLATLSGPLLRKKRNLIRQFERNVPDATFADIGPGNLETALTLARTLNQKLQACTFLEEEDVALAAVRESFPALEMGGLLLFAGGQPVGFSLYSRINADTWDIHFEKADHTIKGAPQALTAELAKRLLARGGRLMNREQDMGEPGLRQAKRSLDPCGFVRRVFLKLK